MSTLLTVTNGPFRGETGYYAGPATLTEHEMNYVYPPRTAWLSTEDSERHIRVAPEHLEEMS